MTGLDLDEKTRKEYSEILRKFKEQIEKQKKWEDSLSEEQKAFLDEQEKLNNTKDENYRENHQIL